MDAQEARIYTAILITAVVLGVIIIYFFISIIRQQRKNLDLHRQNIFAEITQIEKERGRIAADLHDDLGPLLSAVKMKVNSFELPDKSDEVQRQKTNTHIDSIMTRLREISFNLMPTSLLRKGIYVAIRELIDYLNTSSTIKFSFTFDGSARISEQHSINLYRIIQEIVHNTLKHSKATEVLISLKPVKNKLQLTVSDNGIGFDYAKESKESIGFGLRSLLNRTEIMGGQMFLASEKGKGTSFTFEFPIQ